MRISSQRRSFSLRSDDIDRLSEWLGEVADDAGMETKAILRARFFVEDILIGMQEHFAPGDTVSVTFESRLNRPHLRLEVRGSPYNPLANKQTQLGEWEGLLRTAIGISAQYSYAGGTNVLRIAIPTSHMNPIVKLGIFMALGVLVGIIANSMLPDAVNIVVSDVFLKPFYDMWNRLLNAISGPIVFLTVATTMLSMQDVDAKGGNSRRVIIRYFAFSIVAVAIAAMFVGTLHPLEQSELHVDTGLVQTLIGYILSIVPSNIFDPFVESNTSQLLFLAFALGYMLIRIGDGAQTIQKGILEANAIGLMTAEWVSRLVPLFVAAFLSLEIMMGQTDILIDIWRPLLLSLGLSIAGMLLALVGISARMRMSPLLLARKIWRPFVTALRTGSLDQAFDDLMDSNTSLLGIDHSYSKKAVPQGLVLYMPISAVGTIAFTIYVAQLSGVQSTLLWYVSAIVMAVVVFVATPPVPGANLLAYVVLFATLGIPSAILIDAMIFDVLFGIFAGAANQAMLQLEIVLQADHFGLLERELLVTDSQR